MITKIYFIRPSISYTLISGVKVAPLKIIDPPQGFLWNTTTTIRSRRSLRRDKNYAINIDASSNWHSIAKRQLAVPTTSSCSFVNVTCGKQLCGIRPNLGGWDNLPNVEGRFPWHATLFLGGQYLCGATLIAPEWLLASANCFRNIR